NTLCCPKLITLLTPSILLSPSSKRWKLWAMKPHHLFRHGPFHCSWKVATSEVWTIRVPAKRQHLRCLLWPNERNTTKNIPHHWSLFLRPPANWHCKLPKPLVLMQNTSRLPQSFQYMVALLMGHSWRDCVEGLPLWWEPLVVSLIT